MSSETRTTSYDSRPDTVEHIEAVRRLLFLCVRQVLERAAVHDQSKLQEPELSAFNTFTPKLRDSTYGSEEYHGFREAMGEALRHHYAHNRHHPEHFASGIRGMNLLDLMEMLCDWIAASERQADGDVRRSVDINQKRFGYSDELRLILHNTLDTLGVDGSLHKGDVIKRRTA